MLCDNSRSLWNFSGVYNMLIIKKIHSDLCITYFYLQNKARAKKIHIPLRELIRYSTA